MQRLWKHRHNMANNNVPSRNMAKRRAFENARRLINYICNFEKTFPILSFMTRSA